ncbi:Streptomycin 3''-adenylyltransferase [compost metagenome]
MWRTAATGEFVSKDAAASWVAPLVPIEIGETLGVAAEAYLGKAVDDWSARAAEAQQASDYLQGRLLDLL